jgi:hypothetical protein
LLPVAVKDFYSGLLLTGGMNGILLLIMKDESDINDRAKRMIDDTVREPPDYNHLPVRLTVEVGHADLTLKDLQESGDGSRFTLIESAGDAVLIKANGMPVGLGEVLEIGDRFGVRVTEMFDAAEMRRRADRADAVPYSSIIKDPVDAVQQKETA